MFNIAQLRLRNQRLIDAPFREPVEVVRWFGAMQAQEFGPARWGIGMRMSSATDDGVHAAFTAGTIVRTHAMRPTWHFVAAEDLRWILALTSPRVQRVNGHMYRRLELDDVALRKTRKVLVKALEGDRSLMRAELGIALRAKRIEATGQRLAYIAMDAELEGIICSGPMRGKQHTYALVDERVPPTRARDHDEALEELARRYFTSHGPATVHDFSWWSGVTVGEARRALQMLSAELESRELAGKTYWLPTACVDVDVKLPVFHLAPIYDEHIVAYRDHGPSLDRLAPRALDGWGNALTANLVLRNGLVIGGWRRVVETGSITVRMDVRIPLKPRERTALKREAAEYGSFMNLPVEIEYI